MDLVGVLDPLSMTVPKKTPKNPQIAALNEAVEAVLADYEKLSGSIARLKEVATRGKGKPANTERTQRIQELLAAGHTIDEIMFVTDASESTVRRCMKPSKE
jgi:DNA-binding NarL/FixJ family response regulator